MPKVNRGRSHSRHVNSTGFIESITSNETETFSSDDEEEEEEILFNPNADIDHIDFSNESHLGHTRRDVDYFLTSIGGMTIKTCHTWTNILVNKDFDEFTYEERGGKRGDSFWHCYPDLELEAKQFVFEECSKTEATFTAGTLARFIDQSFYELNNLKKIDQQFVRSVESCRLDLRRFGVKFTANSSRPYFLVHEREDVRIPTTAPTILLCHDESTYQCGELTAKRWIMPDNAPFYNKVRGRNYEKNSASAAIALGGDNYFNNQSILNQFKRLFQL
ncbi:unnamed protein product [Rotaria magnacalcarata]|uniref:Uncharacterized protein n=1 Tax=Rotaria magnacalcarata TaxID=392030 RepID=A0A820AB93_9BILA|nr:unnamed protein product [Rotaria magnacalcarata]